jgi:uncharacterized protein (DUF3820 family)
MLRELLPEVEDVNPDVLPRGRFVGQEISDVPLEYLRRFLRRLNPNAEGLRVAIQQELARRGGQSYER